jgi:glycosyltransferase involved in cell wall biosynthesis
MTSLKVTVVVCTYNHQAFICETIDSILAQSYSNLEIIITDDGSTDDTPRLLQEYAQRLPNKIKIVLSTMNTGIPANFNRGLAQRTGELVVCMDGDDLLLPRKIEQQVAFLQQHPEVTGCYHDVDVLESETGRILGRMSLLYNGTSSLKQGRLQEWLVPRNFFLPGAIMYRSSACPPHGYDERLKYLSEVIFYAEVFRTGLLLSMPDVLMRYRRHTRNITDSPVARNLMPEYELMAYAILEARYPELHPLLRRLRVSCRLSQAIRYYREGQPRTGRAIISNVLREGAFRQGLTVWAAMTFLRQQTVAASGSSVYTRASWIKRLARRLLR